MTRRRMLIASASALAAVIACLNFYFAVAFVKYVGLPAGFCHPSTWIKASYKQMELVTPPSAYNVRNGHGDCDAGPTPERYFDDDQSPNDVKLAFLLLAAQHGWSREETAADSGCLTKRVDWHPTYMRLQSERVDGKFRYIITSGYGSNECLALRDST